MLAVLARLLGQYLRIPLSRVYTSSILRISLVAGGTKTLPFLCRSLPLCSSVMGRGGVNLALVGGGGCCLITILIAVLVGVSVKSLDSNDVGLDYDTFGMTLGGTLYSGGTFFLGLAHV